MLQGGLGSAIIAAVEVNLGALASRRRARAAETAALPEVHSPKLGVD